MLSPLLCTFLWFQVSRGTLVSVVVLIFIRKNPEVFQSSISFFTGWQNKEGTKYFAGLLFPLRLDFWQLISMPSFGVAHS